MKLRVQLERPHQPSTTVQIVADGSATAGDVALAIASAGQDEPVDFGHRGVTLRMQGDFLTAQVLSPDLPIADAGLVSGASVSLAEATESVRSRAVAATLRVVSGPDSGVEVQLPPGTSVIGRGSECDVRLTDPRISKRHARIMVGRQIEIVDENSANGVVRGGQKIVRGVVGAGDVLQVGDTHIEIRLAGGDLAVSTDSEIRHLRPPVVLSRPSADEVELPEVPGAPQRAAFPWLALLAPIVMGVAMFAFTRSPMTILFVAMSPVLMLGAYIGNVVDSRRKSRTELANFRAAMDQAHSDVDAVRELEAGQRRQLYPSVSTCVSAALERDHLLWSRRPEHPEFLQVGLGVGAVPAMVRIKEPRQTGLADLVAEQRELRERRRLIPDVPIVADLRSVGGIGIAGSRHIVAGVARGIVAQVTSLHSPAEVVVACLTSNQLKREWQWLEWLPHTASAHSPVPGPLLASDDTQGRALLDQLEELIALRSDEGGPTLRGPLGEGEEPSPPVTPSILLVVHGASVSTERLAHVAERGPDVGVHVLWVAETKLELPAACRTYLEMRPDSGAVVGMVRSERMIRDVVTESMDLETAAITARALAPVVDASAPVHDETDLPRSVSVIGMLGHAEATDPDLILTRWRDNGSLVDRQGPAVARERAGDLRAIVGHAGSEPFTLDLRSQGPHALVGGTTGAGKSEFLQAWVLGMAQAFSPDRVTFLFVDYKGGAAFAKCVDLPHCVGMVTDLSTYLVRRALRSLRAEIRRREHLFNDKGVKDLIDFEKTSDPDCPPSLIIIVDEFAALVGEVPEFVDGVIDVAQRGRSLGLHLILATQRPAGVIKDSLRANTNLRIALRMNDAHDSSDVLGSAVAASIDPATPGRGVARVGPGRLIPFQSSFPGARTPDVPPAPLIEIAELDFGAATAWKIPRAKAGSVEVDKDLERVVDSITDAAKRGAVPTPRRPWLETLSRGYDLKNLNQRTDARIVLGVIDDPDSQSQRGEYFEPDESGNIVYYGVGGSGKTTALRSLAVAASITPRSGPVHIYALDFAGGGLGILEPLVNVGAVISGDDDERITRLMGMLSRMLDSRAARFNAVRADTLSSFREHRGHEDEPRILVLVDGIGTFRAEYDSGLSRQAVFAQFQRLINEGRAVGIHFAVTADRSAALPSSMQGAFQHRIVLRMSDPDSYLGLGVPKDVLDVNSPPGRCLNAANPNEMQLAVLGRDPSPLGQAREIELLAASVSNFQKSRPESVRRMPERVAANEMPISVAGQPTLGIEEKSLGPVGFDPQGVHIVAGAPRSGVSSTMQWLAESMKRAMPEVPRILFSARTTPLAGLEVWTHTVSGVDKVRDYLDEKLKPHLAGEASAGRPNVALFIDQLPEFAGSLVDMALAEAVKETRRNGHLLFAAGETSGFSAFGSSVLGELKGSRAGMLLQPDDGDGDLLKTPLPRGRKADFPIGRGYWIRNGVAQKIQIPVVE